MTFQVIPAPVPDLGTAECKNHTNGGANIAQTLHSIYQLGGFYGGR